MTSAVAVGTGAGVPTTKCTNCMCLFPAVVGAIPPVCGVDVVANLRSTFARSLKSGMAAAAAADAMFTYYEFTPSRRT